MRKKPVHERMSFFEFLQASCDELGHYWSECLVNDDESIGKGEVCLRCGKVKKP